MEKGWISCLHLFLFVILIFGVGAVIAAPSIWSVSVNGTNSPDIFFSNYSGNSVVNIIVNVTGINTTGLVVANFSLFTNSTTNFSIDCGAGQIVNLSNTTYGGSIFNGSCNVGDEAAMSNFVAAPIIITAFYTFPPAGPWDANGTIAPPIILYNMTTPPSMPVGCQRFGNQTTNFASVLNFASVNFVIQIEQNGSCLTGPGNGTSPWYGFQQVLMMNFSSLNMSDQGIGQKLALLRDALVVNIVPPHEHGTTRVFLNETIFRELDTNTIITLNNIPFYHLPTITSNNASRVSNLNASFTLNPPFNITIQSINKNILVPNGNLVFSVSGFTEYNSSDIEAPIITLFAPSSNLTNNSAVLISAIVNGTGTDPSFVSIILNSSLKYDYNASGTSTLNCTGSGTDVVNCTILTNLSQGNYLINVTAWDYGNVTPGNVNSAAYVIGVDSLAPQFLGANLSLPNGTGYSASNSYQFYASYSDASAIGSVKINFNGANYTMNSLGGGVYGYNFSLLGAGTYPYYFMASDVLGNFNVTGATSYSIVPAVPSLSLGNITAWSVGYGTPTNVSGIGCVGGITCVLYNNGVAKGSSEYATLGAGNWTYVFNTTGNQNYSAATSAPSTLVVSQATPTLSLSNSNSWSVGYGNITNVSGNGCVGGITCVLSKNGIVVAGSSEYATLGGGNWTYVYNTTGNQNYSATSSAPSTLVVSQVVPSLSLSNSNNWSVGYGNITNVSGNGCVGGISCVLSKNGIVVAGTSEYAILGGGSWTYVYNTTGNQNYSASSSSAGVLVVSQATGIVRVFVNNSYFFGVVTSSNVSLLINASLISGSGAIQVFNNGSLLYNGNLTGYNLGNLTNFTAPGAYNITAIYAGNENYTGSYSTLWVNYVGSGSVIANSTNMTIDANTTSLVVGGTSTLQNVIVPANSTQAVTLDLSSVVSNGMTTANNGFNLVRQSSSASYSAVISSGTNISAASGWDGKISIPIVNTTTFSAPTISGATTSVSLVVNLGSGIELNFSSPVKVVISGMAGKRAGWSRGSTSLTNIETYCNNGSNMPTNINNSVRECYTNDSTNTDLIIWTLHFTDFAAFTSTATSNASTSSSSGGGGGLMTTSFWKKTTIISDEQFSTGYAIKLMQKQRARVRVGSLYHYVGIISMTSTSAIVNISSASQQAALNVGEEKRFDVNEDGAVDLSVKLEGIANNSASLLVKAISEQTGGGVTNNVTAPTALVNKTTTPTTIAPQEPPKTEKKSRIWIVLLMIVIILIVIGIVFELTLRKKNKKKSRDFFSVIPQKRLSFYP